MVAGVRGGRRAWRQAAAGVLLWAACAAGLAPGAGAQAPAPGGPRPSVVRIDVEGNRQVPAEQILQWFGLGVGDRFDPSRLARAVRELAAKKRFEDVRVEGEEADTGIVLHVIVREYPQLGAVRIEGAKQIKDKEIQAAIKLAPGAFLTPAELRSDRDKIVALYRDKGYYNAAVADTLLAGESGKPALVFRLTEGEKVKVQKVAFVGNVHGGEHDLRKAMTNTKEEGFLGLRGGDLKSEKLQEDFEKVAAWYRDRGYLDAGVDHHELVPADNGRDLILRVYVKEGPRYSVGNIAWAGNSVFSDSIIQSRVRLFLGSPFSESRYEATTTGIYELYNDRGYIHFNAVPKRDVRGTVVNLTYAFTEGDAANVGDIRIVGNTKTHDKVILREMSLHPGEKFDRSRLMRSIRDVYSLGFFEDAGVQNFTPQDDGTVDLELRVAERQTGQLGAGAGYSAVNAVTGFIEVAETNLFGTGNRMSFRWEFSRRQNDLNFSYSMPWVWDTPTSMGIDLYDSSHRSQVNDFYRDQRTGGSVTLGRRLEFLDYTRASWRFRAERIELTDFSLTYRGPLRARFANGPRRTISTGLTLRRDSTNDPFFPSAGSEAELSTDLFGTFLGGDENYLRTSASLAWFQPLGISKFSLMLRSRFGMLRGLRESSAPDYELFRLGGSRYFGVRGYDDFEIVPNGNPQYLGGQAMSIYTAEIVFPVAKSVHASLFFDAGDTWKSFAEADLSFLRKGAGVGVKLQVPMLGQLGLDYGYGFDRVDALGRDRDGWNLHFNFGQLF